MTIDNAVKLWFEQSCYDFETAKAMFKTKRYLYVAFMCQQAIEKRLKACLQSKTGKLPPYTHNLMTLANLLAMRLTDENMDLLDLLSRYYINTRYPLEKQSLAMSLNADLCNNLLKLTEGFLKWLKKELKI